MKINLSIALVTRNRPESLERTLNSLYKQNVNPYEVIISDDSDNVELAKKNLLLAKKFGYQYVKGPQLGLYSNRNFVAKLCNGTHIRSMDDDHEFPPYHMEKCIAAIETHKNVIWTIGEYYPDEKKWTLPAPIPGQLHPRGYSYPPAELSNYYGISCGATIYPRSVVTNNILNLETYQFGDLYLEYGARLVNYGYTIKPLETTYIIHHYDKDNRSLNNLTVINSAKVFSMLMFSFYHKKNITNQLLTVAEIILGMFTLKYSPIILLQSFRQYKKEKDFLSSIGYKPDCEKNKILLEAI